MSDSSVKSTDRAVRGVLWSYASYYGGKLLIFLSTVILARLLTKEEFGVAGYALVAISSLDALTDLGVGSALIYYRKDPDAAHTAFWLGMGVSFALFVATFTGAPLVGDFFNDPRAIPVTRAMAFTFPLAAMGNIHDVLLRRELAFGRKFIPDVTKAFGKGLVTVLLALFGFGSWSLIFGQLAGEVVAVIVLWKVMPWRPSFKFIRDLARALLGYGWNIVAINMLSILLNNASYLLVGRFMGAAALGLYTLAFRIPEMLILQFCSIISRVIFPFYANMQDDIAGLKRGYIASTRFIMLITLPIGAGIALIAYPLVQAVFGSEWVDAAPVMQAIATFAVVSALAYNAGDVYKARGKPQILTWLTIVEIILLVPSLYYILNRYDSIALVGWVHAAVVFVISVIDIVIACRMLKVTFMEIIGALSPSVIASGIMALVVLGIMDQVVGMAAWIQLISGILTGVLAYGASLMVFQRQLVFEGINVLKTAMVGRHAHSSSD